ncbi:MAG: NAD-dependent epimerase/dehydratase family protein [Lachnospiraceae bacterium]|nr:NAD-dependent epimerase/dehydratase family protein [Lachnospiraceae bacterium]
MKKTVLILGGNGFIGRNLAHAMNKKGYIVYSFDMSLPLKNEEGINYIQGDFFDDDTLFDLIQGKNIIYHAISTVNPGNSNKKFMQGYERDFVQTVKLCGWLKNTNTKMIFLSSGGTVYGNQEIQPIKETAVPVPINHYGNVKLCIENTIRTFNFQNSTNILVARISNPYGPGQDYHKGVGFIDAALKCTLEHKPIEIWGDGENVRDYIYIDDVCEMLITLAEYNGDETTFNLSSGKGMSLNDIVSIIRNKIADVDVIYKEHRSVDARRIVLSNDRICEIYTGNMLDIEDGIEKYADYLRTIQMY